MAQQKPSIGRIVHYLVEGRPGEIIPRAAIITEVEPGDPAAGTAETAGLFIMSPANTMHLRSIPYGERPGCWCWPPRV